MSVDDQVNYTYWRLRALRFQEECRRTRWYWSISLMLANLGWALAFYFTR